MSKKAHKLDEHIGLQLRRLRNRHKYSLEKVGEWLDLSKQQVSRLESGGSRLNVIQLYQIARGFNMPISWFFAGFEDDKAEVTWIGNMIREDRTEWAVSGQADPTEKLLSLWALVDDKEVQQKILDLLAVMAGE